MANTITGRILTISPTAYINLKNGEQLAKRTVVLDCPTYDRYTGEKLSDNTPELEFAGKCCETLDGFKAGELVTVSFDVTGSKYTNRDGEDKIFTRIRAYRMERYERQQKEVRQAETPVVVQGVNNMGVQQTLDATAVYGEPQPKSEAPAPPAMDDGLPF